MVDYSEEENKHLNELLGSKTIMDSKKHTALPTLVLLLLLSGSKLAMSQRGQSDPKSNQHHYDGRLSPVVAVFVVGPVTVLFFMGFLIVYIRHYTSGINHTGVTNVAVARGLDAAMIETFPTFAYSEVIGKSALECAICLNEFENDETLRLLPKCDHVFHPKCIDAWLRNHVTCPVCRTDLSEQQKPVEPQTEMDVEAQQPTIPEPAVELSESIPRVKFLRSYTMGHLVMLPEENTDRFTLKLPEEIRKNTLANRKLNRQTSLFILPSCKHVDQSMARVDRWLFRKTPSFLWRNRDDSSIIGGTDDVRANVLPSLTNDSVQTDRWGFLRNQSFMQRSTLVPSPKVGVNKDDEGTSSVQRSGTTDSIRLPV